MGIKRIAAAVLFASVVLSAGCKKAPSEYRIGAIFSVTGEASFLGEPEKNTVMMLVDEVNASGGINGVPLKVIVEDDAGDLKKTASAARKLVEKDSVLAILGPSRSGNTLEIMDYVADRRVPMISCAASETIVSPGNDWVFKTPQRDSHSAELILRQIYRDGITKIAVFYEDTLFGRQGIKHINELMGKYGIVTVAETMIKNGDDEEKVGEMVEAARKAGAGAYVGWSIIAPLAYVPRQLKARGVDAKFYCTQGSGNDKFFRMAGAAAEGIILPGGKLLVADSLPDGDPQKKIILEYKKKYELKFHENVGTPGGHAYDAFTLVVDALRKGGADRDRIRTEIENVQNHPGVDGVFNMSRQDHNGLSADSLEILVYRGGAFHLLNPPRN